MGVKLTSKAKSVCAAQNLSLPASIGLLRLIAILHHPSLILVAKHLAGQHAIFANHNQFRLGVTNKHIIVACFQPGEFKAAIRPGNGWLASGTASAWVFTNPNANTRNWFVCGSQRFVGHQYADANCRQTGNSI